MSLFLSKLLPVFIYPLGACLLLGVVAGGLILLRWKRFGLVLGSSALLLLWVSATPVFAQWLYGKLEGQHPALAVEALPQADAAIVLGGAMGPALPPRVTSDLGHAADRVFHGWRLYRAGKVRRILIAAGNVPWQSGPPEGELIAALLVELGVPRDALIIDRESRNTRENALNAARLMKAEGLATGLLVTSAGHMPRALGVFASAGVSVTPATTDVAVTRVRERTLLDWLPDAEALALTTRGVKEHLGRWVYRARGWI